jgi:hypothetical protein
MAALLLVVTGVLPATAFVARAHDVNMESYVKHRQLELARTIAGRPRGVLCEQKGRGHTDWNAGIDEYFDFFYRTRLACTAADVPPHDPATSPRGEALVAFLEDYMPYYGEFSVGMRELLHARAGDGSWTSRRTRDGDLELMMPTLTARSSVPSFRTAVMPAGSGAHTDLDLPHHPRVVHVVPALLAIVALGLALLVRGIVDFALGHVFLSRVVEPLCAFRRRRTPPERDAVDAASQPAAGGGRRTMRPQLESFLAREERPDPFLRRICDDIRQSEPYRTGALTRDHVLDELEERASNYYRGVWHSCSDEEKLVLGHVAQQGLVNAASRRVVRRLLMRELIFKDPSLRLMSEAFRRFVLSSRCRAEVASLEGEAEPSTWDRLRAPLALGAVSVGIFLFVTQREVFDSTLTTVAGVTAAVPTLFRLASLVMDRRPGQAQEVKA